MGALEEIRSFQFRRRVVQHDMELKAQRLRAQKETRNANGLREYPTGEVELFEAELLSWQTLHTVCDAPVDWVAARVIRPSAELPTAFANRVLAAQRTLLLTPLANRDARSPDSLSIDETERPPQVQAAAGAAADAERVRTMAAKVLAGQDAGFVEAASSLGALRHVEQIGSAVTVLNHGLRAVVCDVVVQPRESLPSEMLSLTATGKLSRKAIPKERRHEIYQDYVCSAALRLAREALALFPVEMVMVNALVEQQEEGKPIDTIVVLSLALDRAADGSIDYASVDPSDAVEALPHRGDVRANRRSGKFTPVDRLPVPETTTEGLRHASSLQSLTERVRALLGVEQVPLQDEIQGDARE